MKAFRRFIDCHDHQSNTFESLKDGVKHHCGLFSTPREAYQAYCKKAKELYGEFAKFS